ncbi:MULTISPECIES: MFS transporter [unclassified Burkholderia]|uniref:MFS transporter n=1 Tax=unclassified Burkholderia TaxID=2613784 RepID=UPI00141E8D2A|nr:MULTISPECIES: MFS transporter [unclassified Burkholderia]NIE55503.1 MFS transporter [Burkholderia sp. Ap-955]NIF08749.1 MFS transporter [Burkholderia sp. Ax-1735]NIG02303.1 MFS transporter [Burkholderia sp. Tr-849]
MTDAPVLRPLLSLAFLLNFSRALTFTFFPIYLSTSLGFSAVQVGYALGCSVMIATLGGIYCGILVDRFTPLRALLLVIAISAAIYALIPMTARFSLIFACLVAIELAFTTMHLSIKSLLTGILPEQQRSAAFSANYTIINLAFCTAPVAGLALSHWSALAPMLVSAALNLSALAVLIACARRYRTVANLAVPQAGSQPPLREIVAVLAGDRRLQLFTLGGLFSSLVYARFTTYLSQYVGHATDTARAETLISFATAVNAATVILLQYLVGSRISHRNMLAAVMAGSVMLIAGLLVYDHSMLVAFWIVGTLIFTLGEILIVPSEFMFVDSIARNDMKGAYFGVQNISMLGGGLNTILCGFLLNSRVGAHALFYIMACFAATGCLFYIAGVRHRAGTQRIEQANIEA